ENLSVSNEYLVRHLLEDDPAHHRDRLGRILDEVELTAGRGDPVAQPFDRVRPGTLVADTAALGQRWDDAGAVALGDCLAHPLQELLSRGCWGLHSLLLSGDHSDIIGECSSRARCVRARGTPMKTAPAW